MTKISIILQVNNKDKIKRCLDSIKKQTLKDFELICIYNKISLEDLKILKQYKNDIKIKYFELDLNEIHNIEELSTSPYITFIDSNDLIDEKYLETLLKIIIQTGTNICIARQSLNINSMIYLPEKSKNKIFVDLYDEKSTLLSLNTEITGKLFKKEFFENMKNPFLYLDKNNYLAYLKSVTVSFTESVLYHKYKSLSEIITQAKNRYKKENVLNETELLEQFQMEFYKQDMHKEFKDELEMIFIRKIFEIIDSIAKSNITENNKKYLIEVLLNYMGSYYPTWESNKYYKKIITSNQENIDKYKTIKTSLYLYKNGYLDKIRPIDNPKKIIKKYEVSSK